MALVEQDKQCQRSKEDQNNNASPSTTTAVTPLHVATSRLLKLFFRHLLALAAIATLTAVITFLLMRCRRAPHPTVNLQAAPRGPLRIASLVYPEQPNRIRSWFE